MLEFKSYQGSTLASEGRVIDLVGKKGTISLIPRNFKDESKRVVVILTKEDGTSASVSCSKAVSEGLRNKTMKLEQLVGFNIVANEEGVPFIAAPSAGLVTVSVESLTIENFTPSVVSYEELIA